MRLLLIGLNHQTAPVNIRERLAFAQGILKDALAKLKDVRGVREALILSTCNRTELYVSADGEERVLEWMAEYQDVPVKDFMPYLYIKKDSEVVRHVFRVSCGLDSMVLGEPQILGQMKDAARAAQESRCLGSSLNMLFQRTFTVAKDIRSHTAVGENSVSMAAAAVKMAERIFPRISDLNVLFIGAGEMIELVATYFAAKEPKRMTVANRTKERAELLCGNLGSNARSATLADLPIIMHEHDVVVSSTASQLPLVGKGVIEDALRKRRNHPMFLLDLAVPRDIEPQVAELRDAFLYTVDDIAEIVQSNKESRKRAAMEAERIVEERTLEYMEWQKSRETVPLIVSLREEGEEARREVLKSAMRLLRKGEDPEAVLERLSVQLTNKLLHAPTKALNPGHGAIDGKLVDAVKAIWKLKPSERGAASETNTRKKG